MDKALKPSVGVKAGFLMSVWNVTAALMWVINHDITMAHTWVHKEISTDKRTLQVCVTYLQSPFLQSMPFLSKNPICTREKMQTVIPNSSVNSFNIVEEYLYHKV